MLREVDRIDCADEDGNLYTVIVRRKVISHRPNAGPASEKLGSEDFILAGGWDVIPVKGEDDAFEILESGDIIRRI